MNPRLAGLCSVMLLVVLPACRSTGPQTRPATPGSSPARAFVGQQRILLHKGDTRRVSLERKALGKVSGRCDVAVEVRQAALEQGTLRLGLERLGRAVVEGAGRTRSCDKAESEILLSISGFSGSEDAAALDAAVGAILASPERYLTARGLSFEPGTHDPKATVAYAEPGATAAERALRGQVRTQPRRLLWVDPEYHDPNRKVRHEGEVEFQAVVGADGRLRDARLQTSLSAAHEAHVRRALGVWRYQPARRQDGPVPFRLSGRLVFRIY